MANFNSTYNNLSEQTLTAAFSTPGPDCHLKQRDFEAQSPVDQEEGTRRSVSLGNVSIDRVPYGSIPDRGPMYEFSEAEAVQNLAESIQAALGGPLYIDFPPDFGEEPGSQYFQWAGNVKRESGVIEILIVTGWLRLTRVAAQSSSPVW